LKRRFEATGESTLAGSRGIKKVLVLAPSLKSIGGVQSYTKTLASALDEILGAGCVRLVTVGGEPQIQRDGRVALESSVKLRFAVHAFTTAIVWRPELVIAAHISVAPLAQVIEKYTKIPYWLVLHGIEAWGKLPPAKRRALGDAARYVTLTRFTLDATVLRHALGNPAAVLLPPPVEVRAHRASGNSGASHTAAPMVLTVGRLAAAERYKGHDIMLEAWPTVLRRVPGAEYWIVGDGDDRKRLESRAQELGIAESVRFTGALTGDQLSEAYERCSIFAMPARTELQGEAPQGEGFGIVFLEAMAHGKPVVGPRNGAPAEFIRSDEHGLLVDPSDRAEIAQALIGLLGDPERCRRMGENAREWVAREFTRANFVVRLRQALLQER
jgi:glycosyltransferase involved in cell wall biosynthesis